tara:strand:+ start:519 stop:737 length:219 start_codon:yes stop_codon:yes gene_type:complete
MDRKDWFDWQDFRANPKNTLEHKEFELVCLLHSKYFSHRYYLPCTCKPEPTVTWIKELQDLFLKSKKYRVKK